MGCFSGVFKMLLCVGAGFTVEFSKCWFMPQLNESSWGCSNSPGENKELIEGLRRNLRGAEEK